MVRKACKKRIQNKRLPEERYCSDQNALSPLVSLVESTRNYELISYSFNRIHIVSIKVRILNRTT